MELSNHQLNMLEAVARVAPKEIMKRYKDNNCCIATARIIIEVLKKMHFKNIRPLTVEVNIFNETYVKKGRTPQSDEEAQAWLAEGAWQIILGERTLTHDGQWPGHLAVLVNDRYMLDIAVFQATRPQKNIHLSPILTTVPEDFVKGEDKCGLIFNKCMVVYVSFPQDKTYEAARDWWDVAKSKDIVSEILTEAKVVLAKK